jgi:AraC-like DNA-binding protein
MACKEEGDDWRIAPPQRLPASSVLPWHAHDEGYAAIVLSGGYLEAGDGGRHRAETGQVLIHPPFSGHANWIARRDVEIVNISLPLEDALRLASGTTDYPERLLDEVGREGADAGTVLGAFLRPAPPMESDLPDLLAAAMIEPGALPLSQWAERHGISPRTLNRHFRQAYGITPAHHRWRTRTLGAWREIVLGAKPLADIAASAGFADQAHMTRSVVALTGRSPGRWRSKVSVSFKTKGAPQG